MKIYISLTILSLIIVSCGDPPKEPDFDSRLEPSIEAAPYLANSSDYPEKNSKLHGPSPREF